MSAPTPPSTPRRRVLENVIPLDGADAAQPYDVSQVDDILTRNVPPKPEDLVEFIIPADGRLVDVSGHDGDGKTSFTLSVFIPAAVGRKACGRFAVARPVRTLFISDDTPQMVMRRREAAIISALKLTAAEQALLRDYWLPVRDPSFIFREPGRLAATLAALEAEHRPVDVIVVDNRTTAWLDHPDDPVAAREVFVQVIKPLADRYGVTFAILSHPPKARTDARGNRAALTVAGTANHQRPADLRLGIWKESDDPLAISVKWEKVRDGRIPPPMLFTVEIDPEGWGWSVVKPSDDASLIDRDAIAMAKAALISFIAVERSRQACIEHVKATTGHEGRTTDAALYQLTDEKLVGKRKRGREVVYFPLANPQEGLTLA